MTSPVSGSDGAAGAGGGSRAFERLAEPVRRWIWRKGWTELRDIQERAIAVLMDGEADAILSAATAGGKTEAAFLPLLSSVIDRPGAGGFDLVYVGPLRALINDQFARLEDLCAETGLKVHPWHGDIAAGVKAKARRNPSGVLLITPESLEALFVLRGREVPTLFASTRAIVVDELHALLDSPRGVHMRSLLTRVEIAVGRRIRRIGLSATLGDMGLARAYLSPEHPESVELIQSRAEGQELRVQLRGYRAGGPNRPVVEPEEARDRGEGTPAPADLAARRAIGEHLFSKLRGSRNLVFAGSRQNVELYADLLRQLCEDRALPNEFFPHHASLSRDHRSFVEERLKAGRLPTTAICTSTLELGIDIGDIACVGQIGAPWSVASLRQRLGRSGRRAGQPAVLRMYATEAALDSGSHVADRLRLGLARAIAMIELLVEGWCEPPRAEALHLSTLTHQVLSVVAERGGASARRLYATLCDRGPFRRVDPPLFLRLLRRLGDPEVALLEQAPDGTLLLGREGERLVEHYSFYAVFHTLEEYRVVAQGKPLGTLPVSDVLVAGMTIVFSGRRWRIVTIHDRDKVIDVEPDKGGRPPPFGGDGGLVHDEVVRRMREVLAGSDQPIYLDAHAADLLGEARREFFRLGLRDRSIVDVGSGVMLLATWSGTTGNGALALALLQQGFRVANFQGLVEVSSQGETGADLRGALSEIAGGQGLLLSGEDGTLISEKFHHYLDNELLLADAVSSRLDTSELPAMVAELLGE